MSGLGIHDHDLRLEYEKLLVWLMVGCGLRIGEASAVTLQQFDFEAGMLYVDRQVTQDGENEKPKTAR
ncbi:hypothetical protein GCM10010282_30920 [Streptomyces roseolus]|nr:hypothetical protein GCM10010282_30920 [Streptomyces roseolus]